MPENISIRLEAQSSGDALRLIKTRVVWPDGQEVRATKANLRGRINPAPLLAFFAAYEAHQLSGGSIGNFEFAGPSGSHAASLHHLLENSKKKTNFWLFKVFGSQKQSPGECRIHELLQAPERHGSFVASLVTESCVLTVELLLDGKPLQTGDDFKSLLPHRVNAGDSNLPESEQAEIPLYWGYRPAAHDDIRQTLLACEEQLVITGIALTTVTGILNDPQVVASLVPRILDGKLSITFVVLSDADHPRAHEEGGAELRERVKIGRNALRRFYDSSLRHNSSDVEFPAEAIQVRTYAVGTSPRHFILKADDTIYFGSYLSHEPGANSYLLKLRDAGHGLYKLLYSELDHIVQNSVACVDYFSSSS